MRHRECNVFLSGLEDFIEINLQYLHIMLLFVTFSHFKRVPIMHYCHAHVMLYVHSWQVVCEKYEISEQTAVFALLTNTSDIFEDFCGRVTLIPRSTLQIMYRFQVFCCEGHVHHVS